ncbi:MAG: AAA family ATPase [Candidatus Thiodiazotropha taylori]|uniref:DNA 5'-3' helicase n=1 Tax=Candidatus Thiodiazotropha taylori TaxID=2792791 RepID=A0A9E4T6T7_9GAMM|nr:AAA family ATPase [Candidatus Thiodiazotropha taylori]MCW4259253.1 AAA family ATPase [Candidatus Thiodiazotropha taylori]
MDQLLEMRVIGGMLINSEFITSANLKPDDFQFESMREVLSAMLEMQSQSKTVDLITVAQHLEKNTGENYLDLLQDAYQSAEVGVRNTKALAGTVKDRARERKAKEIGFQLAEDMDVDSAIKSLMDLGAESRRYSYTLSEATNNFYEEVSSEYKGITSGLVGMDRLLGGFKNGDFYVFGARPAMGKTALMLNLSLATGESTGVISAEQGSTQIAGRNMAIMSHVNAWALRNNRLDDHDWSKVTNSTGRLNDMPYYIYDKAAPSIMDVVRQTRSWKHKYKIKILFVDYIQRLKSSDRSRKKHEQVEEICQGLKELARDLNIPVVALAQVNREVEKRSNKRPGMGDLKDSGAIEQEADVIGMLYRDEVYNPDTPDQGIAEINFEKNRHGPIGMVKTAWIPESMRFEDLSTRGET